MRIVGLLVLVACGSKDDLCTKAVAHVFDLTVRGPRPAKDEAEAIDSVREAAVRQCRSEGLSQAQSDCILAAHVPNWDDQLRACAAFAAKPPSWVILRPTREQRQQLEHGAGVPDGPRESKRHFKQLVAGTRSMCGLTEDGRVMCWGEPLAAAPPGGTFVQIATSSAMTCGREAGGTVKCTVADPQIPNRTPTDAFTDFAIDDTHGCGVLASNHHIECWDDLDNDPLAPPLGEFASVVVGHAGACGRTVAGAQVCVGEYPPTPPPVDVLSWTSDEGTCTITKDHQLACDGTERLGPTPTGRFDTVAMMRGHACATRTGGGTICWGENDGGECNVPQ
jgi:Regulator of chromosome condensation (RCC1) repeat